MEYAPPEYASMTPFGRPLRARFLLERATSFVNHGSFGAAPRAVLRAAERWRLRMEANPDRFMREILPRALRRAADDLARFLRVAGRDLAFVENATAGLNAVLRSLPLRRGDEVVATTQTYNAVRQVLRHACIQSGARLVEAPIALPVAGEDALLAAIGPRLGGRTRLLVLDHISSPTGLVFPVRRLARLARVHGAQVLVDGAHAPGQIPIDIEALGVDWYAGNCHKWLFAPKGCAFLWARRGAQPGLHPPVISHGYGGGLAAEFDWTGTRDFSGWLAVPEALRFYRTLGPARVRAYNHRLVREAARTLSSAWDAPLDGPAALHGAMMAVRLPAALQPAGGADAEAARALQSRLLTRYRVVAAIMAVDGALWARVSAQVYNVPQDYARLRDAVAELVRRA